MSDTHPSPPKDPPPPRKVPHPPTTPKKEENKDDDIPESFVRFIAKYNMVYGKIPSLKEAFNAKIGEIMQASMLQNTFFTKNWDLEPDPMIPKPKRQFQRTTTRKETLKRMERSTRFEKEKKRVKRNLSYVPKNFDLNIENDSDQKPIIGTSRKLEKDYLRLKKAPHPSEVRPLEVLQHSLTHILQKSNKQTLSYRWTSDQLKSIRQDLTIQHISNEFSVKVYKTHSQLSLYNRDLKEFNQCQSNLTKLFADGFGNKVLIQEFMAYKILYQVYTRYKYEIKNSETNELLKKLCVDYQDSECLRHAILVHSSMEIHDYFTVLKLYDAVPNQGFYLMRLFIDFVRYSAFVEILKTCKPALEWTVLVKELKLTNRERKAFIETNQVKVENNSINTSECFENLSDFQWEVLDGDNVQRDSET